MNFLAAIDAQISSRLAESRLCFERRRILAMIGQRHKIQADPPAGRRHMRRFILTVRTPGMHVDIPFIGIERIQIGSERVHRKCCDGFVEFKCHGIIIQPQLMFLLARGGDPCQQTACFRV